MICHILVGTDAGGFKGFRAQLFILVRDHVDAEGEFVDIGALSSEIEDANLGVRYTTVESGFRIGLWNVSLSAHQWPNGQS